MIAPSSFWHINGLLNEFDGKARKTNKNSIDGLRGRFNELNFLKKSDRLSKVNLEINGESVEALSFIWSGDIEALRKQLKSEADTQNLWLTEQRIGRGHYWALFEKPDRYCKGLCPGQKMDQEGLPKASLGSHLVTVLPVEDINVGLIIGMSSFSRLTKSPPKDRINQNIFGITLITALDFNFKLKNIYTKTTQGVCTEGIDHCRSKISEFLRKSGFSLIKDSVKSSFAASEFVWHQDRQTVYVRLVKRPEKPDTFVGIQQSGSMSL